MSVVVTWFGIMKFISPARVKGIEEMIKIQTSKIVGPSAMGLSPI